MTNHIYCRGLRRHHPYLDSVDVEALEAVFQQPNKQVRLAGLELLLVLCGRVLVRADGPRDRLNSWWLIG